MLSYVTAWWYGPCIVAAVRRLKCILNLSPWLPFAVFVAAVMEIGKMDDARSIQWPINLGIHSTALLWSCVDVLLALILFLAIALSYPGGPCNSVATWLSSRAADMGKFTLAAYMFHEYFTCCDDQSGIMALHGFRWNDYEFVPNVNSALQEVEPWGGSFAQFLVLMAYPTLFLVIVAPLFHFLLLLLPAKILQAVGSLVRLCLNICTAFATWLVPGKAS